MPQPEFEEQKKKLPESLLQQSSDDSVTIDPDELSSIPYNEQQEKVSPEEQGYDGQKGENQPKPKEGDNEAIRQWYVDQVNSIPEQNEAWRASGMTAVERARKAYDIRHEARMQARGQMNWFYVKLLQARDLMKYGNSDGPTFEQLVAKNEGEGLTGDDAYEAIIDSSARTSETFNKMNNVEEEAPS